MRVVTLLPSATEIAYALGVEPVATSHECDWPPEAADKPAVNYANVDPDASPDAINEQVATAERGDGVYGIDLDALERADPDVVVSQGVCDVCAVDSVLVEEAVDELGLDCEVVTTDPHSLDDVFADIERLGRVFGREERADEVVAGLRDRVDAVTERAPADGPSVAVLDWTDPVMVAGHWVPGMVTSLGAEYGLEEPGLDSKPREWSEVRAYDPDVLVVAPCGYQLDQTFDHLDTLTDREGWRDLTAVSEGRAYAMDGHHYVNRPGPRLVDTLEHLAGLLYPDSFEAPPEDVARPLARRVA
ncbi:ABC transporter substrate-binding protein [Halorarius halobius]|uniref:ABC transporter substrate-binding protein n=1 Tax=Halorarius halobius TaxID=2962671 RepID=UPI0020CF97D3|nr:ABC transporter substrate-binding protein [Halorarius halobius]